MSNIGTLRICEKGHRYYKSSDCPTCPVCEAERKPNDRFLELLSAPTRRALEGKGIMTPEQLKDYSEKEILDLHGMGKSAMQTLHGILLARGYSFKQ